MKPKNDLNFEYKIAFSTDPDGKEHCPVSIITTFIFQIQNTYPSLITWHKFISARLLIKGRPFYFSYSTQKASRRGFLKQIQKLNGLIS